MEAGVRRAAQTGVVGGFACVDFQATLVDGSFHERDSSSLAFELAAAAAAREAFAKAGPQVLEPVMAVEVVTPVEYLGDCIGDLHRRRGLAGLAEEGGAGRAGPAPQRQQEDEMKEPMDQNSASGTSPKAHPIDPAIREEILRKLHAVEAQHGVRVLYACESGSRG